MRLLMLGIVAVACLAGAGCAKSDNTPAKVASQPTMMPPSEAKTGNSLPPVTASAGG